MWLLGAHAAYRKRSQEPVEAAGAAQAARPAFLNPSLEGCCIKAEPGLDGVPLVTPEHSLREKSVQQAWTTSVGFWLLSELLLVLSLQPHGLNVRPIYVPCTYGLACQQLELGYAQCCMLCSSC